MTNGQSINLTRPLRGTILSALATAGMVGIFFAGRGFVFFALDNYTPKLEDIAMTVAISIIFAALSAPFIWVSLVSVGIPLHWILERNGLTKLWHYAASGQAVGSLCAAVSYYVVPTIPHFESLPRMTMIMFAGFGGIAAALAWHFSQTKPRGRKGP